MSNIRQTTEEWSRNLWSRVKSLFNGLDTRVTALEQGGGGGGGGDVNVIESITLNGAAVPPDANKNVALAESDPTVPAWAKSTTKPTYTAAEVGAKATQSPVTSPAASGSAVAFIDSITQNAQGVITATKKTVPEASQSAAGLMSANDKTKLDGIEVRAQVNSITGVKGNAESTYRTGNVNLTPANIGAVAKSDTIDIAHGGTGATTAAAARSNLGITPANIGAKATQSAVSSPKASGTAVAFIDSITQDEQGVIVPTKKTVGGASQSAAGLMSATDKTKLDGLEFGSIRNPGTVNNTALIGTFFTQGSACTGLPTSDNRYYSIAAFGVYQIAARYTSNGADCIFTRYYINNKWYQWQKIVDTNTSGLVTVAGGGTGANNAAGARTNLGITPANIGAAYAINIASDVNTWSGVFQALSNLPNYTTGTIYAGSGPASKLTGGKLTSYINGVVTRMSDSVFDFMVQSGANPAYMYSFRVTGLTSTTGTPGTVYRFAGTAI